MAQSHAEGVRVVRTVGPLGSTLKQEMLLVHSADDVYAERDSQESTGVASLNASKESASRTQNQNSVVGGLQARVTVTKKPNRDGKDPGSHDTLIPPKDRDDAALREAPKNHAKREHISTNHNNNNNNNNNDDNRIHDNVASGTENAAHIAGAKRADFAPKSNHDATYDRRNAYEDGNYINRHKNNSGFGSNSASISTRERTDTSSNRTDLSKNRTDVSSTAQSRADGANRPVPADLPRKK
jgi:hypothetical protein